MVETPSGRIGRDADAEGFDAVQKVAPFARAVNEIWRGRRGRRARILRMTSSDTCARLSLDSTRTAAVRGSAQVVEAGALLEGAMATWRTTVGVAAATFVLGAVVGHGTLIKAADKNRVLEIRTYTTHEGRLPALVERMGHGEGKVFERLGMKPVGYFVATEAPKSANTFVYILSHESREKARENWAKFGADSQWKEIRERSEAAGPIVAKAETIFVDPTDFSPLK
jgi:hypothetical protein